MDFAQQGCFPSVYSFVYIRFSVVPIDPFNVSKPHELHAHFESYTDFLVSNFLVSIGVLASILQWIKRR